MCTLTYLLTENGYELFFNRDEQRTRKTALKPVLNPQENAVYPVDPVGSGTWIAVHQSGLSLALLNFYQAETALLSGDFISRGQIILSLLKEKNAVQALHKMDLSCFQPFRLCLFSKELCLLNPKVSVFQWDGKQLDEADSCLPITSSSVDYPLVYEKRKKRFLKEINQESPIREQFITYHHSAENEGKLSVNMFRNDAKTVSFSHIIVAENIQYDYFDYSDELSIFSSVSIPLIL